MKVNNKIEQYRQSLKDRQKELKEEINRMFFQKEQLNERFKSKAKGLNAEDLFKLRLEMYSPLIEQINKIEKEIQKIEIELLEKKYANEFLYTDINPYEVIEERTPNLYIIRSMESKQTDESVKQLKDSFIVGGFCGHFDNDLQEWDITSNPNGEVIKVRRHKDGMFYDSNGRRYCIGSKPIKFYDFNF